MTIDLKTILSIDEEGINISKLNAVCGRGGLFRPIEGGTYEVNDADAQRFKRRLCWPACFKSWRDYCL